MFPGISIQNEVHYPFLQAQKRIFGASGAGGAQMAQPQRFIVEPQPSLQPQIVLVTTEQVIDSSGKETIYLQVGNLDLIRL